MRGITFLGTGANSGKSTLAVGLIALARAHGLDVSPFKPVAVVDLRDPSCPDRRPWVHAIYHHESAAGVEHRWEHSPVVLVPDAPDGVGAMAGRLFVRGEACGRARILAGDHIDFAGLDRHQRSEIADAVSEAVVAQLRHAGLIVMEGSGALDQHDQDEDVVNRGPALSLGLPVVLVTKGWTQENRSAVARCLNNAGGLRVPSEGSPLLDHVIVNGIERPSEVRPALEDSARHWDVQPGGVVEAIRYPPYDGSASARQERYAIVAQAVQSGFAADLSRWAPALKQ